MALIAEAFPGLSPDEWTARLLVTADNSWFGALGIPIEGTTDLGGGITHDYSVEWGHGVLDLEAALSPIQVVSVLAGDTVATASRTPMRDSIVIGTAGFGDGLQRALAGHDMAVFDVMNGNFVVDAGDLIQAAPASDTADLVRGVTGAGRALPLATGYTNDLGGVIHRVDGPASEASVLSLATNAAILRGTADGSHFTLSAFGFVGDHQAYGDTLMSGVGVNASLETSAGMFTIGLSQSLERGALLGLVGNDTFDFGVGTPITAEFRVRRRYRVALLGIRQRRSWCRASD